MIDTTKMLDCCKECDYACKQYQWNFDDASKMSGCILADVEMNIIMNKERNANETP